MTTAAAQLQGVMGGHLATSTPTGQTQTSHGDVTRSPTHRSQQHSQIKLLLSTPTSSFFPIPLDPDQNFLRFLLKFMCFTRYKVVLLIKRSFLSREFLDFNPPKETPIKLSTSISNTAATL